MSKTLRKIIGCASLFIFAMGIPRLLLAQSDDGYLAVGRRGEHSIYYESSGEGEPIIFVHGFTLDTRMWDPQWSLFEQAYEVIRYDSIGHGKSSGAANLPQGSVRREDNLRDLMVHLGHQKAHIVGLSMGAAISVEFAITYPEMVRSLTLMDGGPDGTGQVGEPFFDRVVSYLLTSQSQGVSAALDRWLKDPLFAPANENPALQARLEEIVRVGHAALGEDALMRWPNLQAIRSPDRTTSMHQIEAATLAIVGERDLPSFHRDHARTLADVPNVRGVTIRDAGHMSNMERPDEVNLNLASFLASTRGSQDPTGDFFPDGIISSYDIDLLGNALRNEFEPNVFDLNRDAVLDELDFDSWVVNVANTHFGDSNLDGEFNSSDFVAVFQAGQYEDDIAGNSMWSTGDWNADGEFDSSDFVRAFQEGGYETGPRIPSRAVPEPIGLPQIGLALVGFYTCRHRQKILR